MQDTKCAICLELISREDQSELWCRHRYHRACIDAWLKQQATCPYCRCRVISRKYFVYGIITTLFVIYLLWYGNKFIIPLLFATPYIQAIIAGDYVFFDDDDQ